MAFLKEPWIPDKGLRGMTRKYQNEEVRETFFCPFDQCPRNYGIVFYCFLGFNAGWVDGGGVDGGGNSLKGSFPLFYRSGKNIF